MSTVRRPARVFVWTRSPSWRCEKTAIEPLARSMSRVPNAEDLAAAKHGQDRDRDDPGDVLRHPGLEFVGLLPGEEPRLALIGPRDADAVDGSVDLLAAILSSP